MLKKIKLSLAVITVCCASSISNAVMFDLSGNYDPGVDGNVRMYTSGSLSVNVSAWSSDSAGDNWATAALGRYSSGLGVLTSGDHSHTVDNLSSIEYMLFEFSDMTVANKISLYHASLSSDMTVWIGTFVDPFSNHLDLTTVPLSDFTYLEYNNGSGNRVADINSGEIEGNALLIAGNINQIDDSFKILKLTVPDNGGTLALLGMALFAVFSARIRSRK